ncbi:MAG: hypothetical protein AAB969_03160 [Patescibacteria group bacterium]
MNCCPNFEVCDCDCHRLPAGMMQHCMPCCNKCPYCGKNIKWHSYDEHIVKCGKERLLICTSDNEVCDCEYHQWPGHCLPPCCKVCPHCERHIKETHFAKHVEKCEARKHKK